MPSVPHRRGVPQPWDRLNSDKLLLLPGSSDGRSLRGLEHSNGRPKLDLGRSCPMPAPTEWIPKGRSYLDVHLSIWWIHYLQIKTSIYGSVYLSVHPHRYSIHTYAFSTYKIHQVRCKIQEIRFCTLQIKMETQVNRYTIRVYTVYIYYINTLHTG